MQHLQTLIDHLLPRDAQHLAEIYRGVIKTLADLPSRRLIY
jgi:hypothetical protein